MNDKSTSVKHPVVSIWDKTHRPWKYSSSASDDSLLGADGVRALGEWAYIGLYFTQGIVYTRAMPRVAARTHQSHICWVATGLMV
jgi:hypothetical protein